MNDSTPVKRFLNVLICTPPSVVLLLLNIVSEKYLTVQLYLFSSLISILFYCIKSISIDFTSVIIGIIPPFVRIYKEGFIAYILKRGCREMAAIKEGGVT